LSRDRQQIVRRRDAMEGRVGGGGGLAVAFVVAHERRSAQIERLGWSPQPP